MQTTDAKLVDLMRDLALLFSGAVLVARLEAISSADDEQQLSDAIDDYTDGIQKFQDKICEYFPMPAIKYECQVSAPMLAYFHEGDGITVTGTAQNLDPRLDAYYTWSSDGGKVSGTSNVAAINTEGLEPGTYTVKGHCEQGNRPGQMADCSCTFKIV